MSDTVCNWNHDDEAALDDLRRDAKRGSVKPSRTLKVGKPAPPPAWAEPILAERAEEHEPLERYRAAPPDVRAWLDGIVSERLRGRKLPELWRDRTLRDVLLDWKRGALEDIDAA
jgi:hypothetical protein